MTPLTLEPITYTCTAIPGVPSWWPRKRQGQTLTYALDISAEINTETDVIQTVEAMIAPSGAGEEQGANLDVSGDVLTLTLSAGQPTRIYTILFTVTMVDANVYQFLVYQGIPPGLPGYPVQPPPNPGYGTALTWVAPPGFDFRNPNNSGYIGILGGHG